MEPYIIDERKRVLGDTVADALNQVVPHHFVGLPYLVLVCFKVGFYILFQKLLVELLEVLVLIEFSEDLLVLDALETPHLLGRLVFEKDLVG